MVDFGKTCEAALPHRKGAHHVTMSHKTAPCGRRLDTGCAVPYDSLRGTTTEAHLAGDIKPVLDDWPYRPDTVKARVITGRDGNSYVQLRLDLGVIQMRYVGRPDGERPCGFESYLDYYLDQIEKCRGDTGSDYGLRIKEEHKEAIDREIIQYYHRRTAFFALKEYGRAAEDAGHSLRTMDLIRKYSDDPTFVSSHERWRPFVTMERARAMALESLGDGDHARALERIEWAREAISRFYSDHGLAQPDGVSAELGFLNQWADSIREKYSAPPTLEEQLTVAVEKEEYERAAELRDQILRLRMQEGMEPH